MRPDLTSRRGSHQAISTRRDRPRLHLRRGEGPGGRGDGRARRGRQRRHPGGADPRHRRPAAPQAAPRFQAPARRGPAIVIPRYTLPEMGAVWSEEARFRLFAQVEVAVVRARARRGLVPAADLAAIEAAPPPLPGRVHELEAQLHHDAIAFLTAYGEGIGEPARHVHYGMTSSDLLDTALAMQLARACDLLAARLDRLVASLRERALEHRD